MSEPPPTDPRSQPPVGGDRRPLDRAPGERYGTRPEGAGGPGSTGAGRPGASAGLGPRASRALVAAMVVADAGAVLFFVLGLLDLGIGLVVIAAFNGWITALALVWWGRDAIPVARMRVGIGAFLGGWSVAGGILLDWIYAVIQDSKMGPLDYVAERYGMVALLALVVGSGVAAVRSR